MKQLEADGGEVVYNNPFVPRLSDDGWRGRV